jgi:single-stranded-DNA-specific exonuclease
LLPALDAQRWQLPPPLGALGAAEALQQLSPAALDPLPEPLLALLARRGLTTAAAVHALLDPPAAPPPHDHCPQLSCAVDRLERACRRGEPVAVCGDYDADGMTSTALLVGVLERLGARAEAAIPSRQEDGYGLNPAMVERLAAAEVSLLVTVDNGVSAEEALHRAAALQVDVILTDHHTLPEQLPLVRDGAEDLAVGLGKGREEAGGGGGARDEVGHLLHPRELERLRDDLAAEGPARLN